MGVQNLWVLLSPVGRQIELESLERQVLAVDASIWLTQFVKAMRDDEGKMIKNAHLIGTFHRVAKLLFFGIRPVFVFDGQTPEIKKRTTARRRKRQEMQAVNLKQTAQRILINRLKLQREELKRNGGKPAPAVDPNFILPDAAPPVASGSAAIADADASKTAEVITLEGDSGDEQKQQESDAAIALAIAQEEKENEDVEEDDDLTIDDIMLDTSKLSKIDLHAVFALPAHLQKDMLMRIQRDRRQEVREQFIPLAGRPEAYSRTQISSFLETSALNRRIAAAKRKNKEGTVEDVEVPESEGMVVRGHGKRIASSSNRFFIYEKEAKESSDDDEDKALRQHVVNPSTSMLHAHATPPQSDKNDSGSQREERSVHDEGGPRFPVLTAFQRNKKRRLQKRAEETKLTESNSTSTQSSTERHHIQNPVADAATDVWFSIQPPAAPREPVLAIEKNRQARLKTEQTSYKLEAKAKPMEQKVVSKLVNEDKKAICITLDMEDAKMIDEKYRDLFPASMFEKSGDNHQPIVIEDDDDDDVEWEDAKPASIPNISATKVKTPVKTSEAIVVDDDDEDDVEWEDAEALPQVQKEQLHIVHTETEKAVDSDEDTASSVEDDNSSIENEDEMFLSLKNELEDAKGQEDLALLKEEALNSALATASNLTQWAVGAVRRALAAHSQQHGNVPAIMSPTVSSAGNLATKPVLAPVGASVEHPISLDDEEPTGSTLPEDISEGVSAATTLTMEVEQAKKPDANDPDPSLGTMESESGDTLLELAIAKSLEEEATDTSASRYLQYSAVPAATNSPIPPMDVAVEEAKAEDMAAVELEQRELKKLRNRQLRDVDGISDEMVEDVMHLLRLFGVPFLVSPMEAEAQCAALENLGLVDGIITDDSDIFPFGGQKVYKNIFHNQKFVEAFFAKDIKKEFGFSQDEMIALALLLGSDYTDGIRGIGIVNATEVVTSFPGLTGLREFKSWVQAFDITEETRRAEQNRKRSEQELANMTPRERFELTHANMRRKWELGDEFPNAHVIRAYHDPQVDKSDAKFSWALPDLAALRKYCTAAFAWEQSKTDTVLLPLMERIARSSQNGGVVQTRIDSFFTKYEDDVKYARIQSKRLRNAVEGRTTQDADDGSKNSASTAKTPKKSTPVKKKTLQKKKPVRQQRIR